MMTKKMKFGLCAAMVITSFTATAAEVEFKETQTLLQGEDVQSFVLKDMNGDHRVDVIWQTSNGELKYKLQDNQAMVTFDNIKGTKWRLTYDQSGIDKKLDFFNDGGVIEDQSNYQFNIVEVTVTELNQLSFCTDFSTGLNRTRCLWKYQVTEALPNILKGVDQRTGETWTAYKLIN
ncbi:hypothetical protein [Shewanella colwelliana]|uniref:hypothetical protein n=1 Tax=Shewanella colwelliana TaxID=23 RepID=UPI0022AF4C78|nr:hypothetical protein [Shewanella colwelliana]MCZ4339888.1 hypothetical protein [Shewanella colwelliana]